jgi:hypothetical protein
MSNVIAYGCTALMVMATACPAAHYGRDAYRHVEDLPRLTPLTWAAGFSSYERNGANYDRGHFLYKLGAEYMMAEVRGPGVMTRLWTTGQDNARRLRVYLDGQPARIVDKTFGDFFDGVGAPFLTPLCVDDEVSSGGFVSYLPITFSNWFRITSTDANLYYNLQVQRVLDGTPLATWTTNDSAADVRALWRNAGAPLGCYSNTVAITNVFDLAPGAALALADVHGSSVIHSLRIRNPHLSYDGPRRAHDDGRAHMGFSQFVTTIAPSNDGVELVRRLDYGIGDQKAEVRIDGALAGTWYTPGVFPGWFDSAFSISQQFTWSKSVLTVRVEFVSSGYDWNEFTYWTYSLVGTNRLQTDELDVGNSASESAHAYQIGTPTWQGARDYEYSINGTPAHLAWSTGVWLEAHWDDRLTNAVQAPLGLFFGAPFGVPEVRGLLWGCLTNSMEYYHYAPMPFASHGLLIITNRGAAAFSNLWCEVAYADNIVPMQEQGWFHATYNHAAFGDDGRDYVFLETTGCGTWIGVSHWMIGPGFRGYLEGDERVYVDGKATPDIYGTGTEDYYNGGWYFSRGSFTLPTHGSPHHLAIAPDDWTACYRLHLADSVPFRSSLRASIEHGWENNVSGVYASVAYWYGRPEPIMRLLGTFDVGDPAAELAHAYTNSGAIARETLVAAYDGEFDLDVIVDDGVALTGFSRFTIPVDLDAGALVLRRRNDYAFSNQSALVTVNNRPVGLWYQPGSNNSTNHADPLVTNRWREDEFVIPAGFFDGATTATISFAATAGATWTEYRYDVFGLYLSEIPEPALSGGALLLWLVAARGAGRRQAAGCSGGAVPL